MYSKLHRGVALLIGMLILAFAMMVYSSCNAEKKLNKAVNTVIGNPAALDSVWAKVRERRPCVNDTTPPKIIIKSVQALVADSGAIKELSAQLIAQETACKESVAKALLKVQEAGQFIPYGYDRTFGNGIRVRLGKEGLIVTAQTADTTRWVKDREAIEVWKNQAIHNDGKFIAERGTSQQLREIGKKQLDEINVLQRKIWFLKALLIASVVLTLLLKIKIGSSSLFSLILNFINPFKLISK